jgi:glycosyltransferase involved in cell wall biosynthesis
MGDPIRQPDPLVSVCIPTYNRAKKLQRAIDALLASSYKNLEIIISDNASSDDTESICIALAKSDGRIKYFRHHENQGPTANFEYARSQATGKYFLWHGDDDYLDPAYISACVAELENDPFLVLASGVAAYHQGDSDISGYGNIIQPNSESPMLRVLKYLWLVADNSIFCGAYRRTSVEECRMPNCLAGDWIWMAEVLLKGKAKVLPTIYVYRDYGDNTSSSLRRIATTIKAPPYHARFPRMAVSLNLARHLSAFIVNFKPLLTRNKHFIFFGFFNLVLFKQIGWSIRLRFARCRHHRSPQRPHPGAEGG